MHVFQDDDFYRSTRNDLLTGGTRRSSRQKNRTFIGPYKRQIAVAGGLSLAILLCLSVPLHAQISSDMDISADVSVDAQTNSSIDASAAGVGASVDAEMSAGVDAGSSSHVEDTVAGAETQAGVDASANLEVSAPETVDPGTGGTVATPTPDEQLASTPGTPSADAPDNSAPTVPDIDFDQIDLILPDDVAGPVDAADVNRRLAALSEGLRDGLRTDCEEVLLVEAQMTAPIVETCRIVLHGN